MNTIKRFFSCLAVCLAFLPGWSIADDIDLYMGNPSVTDTRPNVLIVLDNTANWNNWFTGEISALSTVIGSLSDHFNVGLMMFSETGNPNSNVDGGYVRAAIRQMTSGSTGNAAKYAALVNSLDKLGDKSNGAKYSLMMWEVFQYFSGLQPHGGNSKAKADYTGNTFGTTQSQAIYALGNNALGSFAATTYNSPVTDNCQKNFVIVISNGPANDNASDNSASSAALSAAGGNTQMIALTPSGQQTNMADEWARFMATHTLSNRPNVVTYTIAVQPGSWPSGQGPDMVALLTSMGSQGQGGYFAASDVSQLAALLNEVLSRINAVNSVFASVTLPVNVNVRGQFLNQIYMGVFRPDKNASPRWPGNLKEYKIQFDTNGNGLMVDSNSVPVFDPTSGFVSPTVTSFWTTATTNSITQLTGAGTYQFGAYKFWDASYYPNAQGAGAPPATPNGTRDGVADAPDGEMVEKGGAAQLLRGTYSYNANTGNERVSTRKVYTCTGTACVSGASLSSMPFISSNTDLTAQAFNIGSTASITSLARGAGTCTTSTCSATAVATTSAAHGFAVGNSITVSNAASSDYNGVFTVASVPSSTSFTYTVPENPAPTASASGTITANWPGGGAQAVTTMSRTSCSGSPCNATVTVNTAGAHGYAVGSSVTITGATPAAYNGSVTIASVPSPTSFTYTIQLTETPNPSLANVSGVTITYYNNAATVASFISTSSKPVSFSRTAGSTLVTVTVPSSNKTPNSTYNKITISGVSSPDQKYNVTSAACASCTKNSTTFTYNLQASDLVVSPAQPSGANIQVSPSTSSFTVTSLTRGNSTCSGSPCTSTPTATATATTASNHGFTTGDTISVSGATQSQFNGNFVITVTAANQFTYTITTSPASPDTGSGLQVSSNTAGISLTDFINWIRGQNTRGEDNPSLRTDDVRGYLHGDVLHSQPAIINYNRSGITDDLVIYYGANDGILHAVKGGRGGAADTAAGNEKWGFIAPEHFGSFQRLFANSPLWSTTAERNYFFDGPITTMVNMVDDGHGVLRVSGTGAEAYVFAAMRRGGRAYYAFDVTDPDAPKFKWKIVGGGTGDFAELGNTWSAAKVGKIKLASGDVDVLVFGGGYDQSSNSSGPTANDAMPQGTATMGRAIYVVNARTGALIWMASSNTTQSATKLLVGGMTCSIAADVFLLDSDGDGYTDRLYAEDTCGNIWRANIGDANTANWAVGKIFALGTASGNARKFLFQPSVVLETNFDALLIGSGDREHPFDLTTTNRFFVLWDNKGKNDLPQTAATESDLCDFTSVNVDANGSITCQACTWPNKKGWEVRFDACPGEKVVSSALTIGGVTMFATNVPPGSSCLQATPSNQCSAGLGEARAYAMYYDAGQCGRPFADTNSNGVMEASDRYTVLKGGGFPPSPVGIVVTDDNGKTGTVAALGPYVITPPGGISTRRHRLYWQMGVDNK